MEGIRASYGTPVISGQRILGLIPARGGSVGIPRKNIRPLGGKPLLAWTVDAATQSRYLDRVAVSTDDEEIAAVARRCGAEVPFLRPAALAANAAQGIDVVRHALALLRDVDAIVLLQPTSPFRVAADIDGALDTWRAHNAPVVSVTESPLSPYLMFNITGDRLAPILEWPAGETNRQHLPVTYALNGAVYVASRTMLADDAGFLTPATRPYLMPAKRSVDLDTEHDWQYAEFLLRERRP